MFLPRDIINNLFSGVPGLRRDFTGQYLVPCNATNLPDIVITMNKNDYVLKPEHYIIKAGVVCGILILVFKQYLMHYVISLHILQNSAILTF